MGSICTIGTPDWCVKQLGFDTPWAVDHTAIAKEQNTVMVTAGKEMFNAIIFFHTGSCLARVADFAPQKYSLASV